MSEIRIEEAVTSKKAKKSIFKRWWFWVLVVFIIFIIAILFSDSSGPSAVPTTTLTLAEMREQAVNVSYDELARYPENFKGKPVVFQGEIIQKVSDTEFRVNITKGEYGFWDDTVYLALTKNVKDARLLEDDIIEFTGLVQGDVTYESIFGQKITIPRIDAYEVNIVGKNE